MLAALVVRLHCLVPSALHQLHFHLLHPPLRTQIWQGEVNPVGHLPGPVTLPEHLYPAALEGKQVASSEVSGKLTEGPVDL